MRIFLASCRSSSEYRIKTTNPIPMIGTVIKQHMVKKKRGMVVPNSICHPLVSGSNVALLILQESRSSSQKACVRKSHT